MSPDWLGESFTGVGIDPKKFATKIDDSVTNVRRYTSTDSAPQFSGNRAFQQFVTNTTASVFSCEDFQINIRLERLTQTGEEFTATLLVESVGSRALVDDDRNRPGAPRRVFQVSSVWQTTWSENESKKFQLLTAKVPATEIVTLKLNAHRLFFDCTKSILGENDVLEKQLKFGVDQWASKLPGIDTQGNSGLSVGDINNDGLDDIYLCQPQGIANRLLIQQSDGDVIDGSHKYGVDLLDESRSVVDDRFKQRWPTRPRHRNEI